MTAKETTPRGAVLQFEIDLKRWNKTADKDGNSFEGGYGDTPYGRLYNMAKTAVCDTIYRGGTFVLVATPDKITMVQRPDAEEL